MERRQTYNKIISFFIISIVCLIIVQALTPIESGNGNVASRFVVTCIFIWCIYRGIHQDYYINPFILFSITPLSLMIYSEKVSSYFLRPLNQDTWIIAILNMIVFLAAFDCANNRAVTSDNKLTFASLNRPNESLIVHAIVLFVIGKLPDLFFIATGSHMPFGQFFSMCQFIGIALAYRSGHKKTSFLFYGIYIAITLLTTFNKTNFLMGTLVLLVCIEGDGADKRQRRKVIFLCLIVAIILILIAFPLKDYLQNGGDISTFFESNMNSLADYYSDRVEWNGPTQLMMPYMYLTTSWNNLQYIMETINTHTYGLWLIKPLLGYMQIDNKVAAYNDLTPFRNAFNTYGFIAVQYIDFGLIGSALSSLLIGLLVGSVYRRYRYNPDGFNSACYGLVACATLEMFFSNHFWGQSYPFTIIIISWLYGKIGLRLVWGRQFQEMKEY